MVILNISDNVFQSYSRGFRTGSEVDLADN